MPRSDGKRTPGDPSRGGARRAPGKEAATEPEAEPVEPEPPSLRAADQGSDDLAPGDEAEEHPDDQHADDQPADVRPEGQTPGSAASHGAGKSSTPVVAATLDAFYDQGYHGTSVREIARRAGFTVAALYYHFPSKHDVLAHIAGQVMQDVIELLVAARDAGSDDPADQLARIVRAHAQHYTSRQKAALVTNTEARSLQPEPRALLVARRKEVRAIYRGVVQAGLDEGIFLSTVHPHEISRAIIGMGLHIPQWYGEGPLTPADIADRYAHLALDMVRYDGNPTDVIRRADLG